MCLWSSASLLYESKSQPTWSLSFLVYLSLCLCVFCPYMWISVSLCVSGICYVSVHILSISNKEIYSIFIEWHRKHHMNRELFSTCVFSTFRKWHTCLWLWVRVVEESITCMFVFSISITWEIQTKFILPLFPYGYLKQKVRVHDRVEVLSIK